MNKMECFIFERTKNRQPVEYKVMVTSELDKIAVRQLHERGVVEVENDEGSASLHVKDAAQARIQDVLPDVLDEIAQEGWVLAAISGPQLYIFLRPAV